MGNAALEDLIYWPWSVWRNPSAAFICNVCYAVSFGDFGQCEKLVASTGNTNTTWTVSFVTNRHLSATQLRLSSLAYFFPQKFSFLLLLLLLSFFSNPRPPTQIIASSRLLLIPTALAIPMCVSRSIGTLKPTYASKTIITRAI